MFEILATLAAVTPLHVAIKQLLDSTEEMKEALLIAGLLDSVTSEKDRAFLEAHQNEVKALTLSLHLVMMKLDSRSSDPLKFINEYKEVSQAAELGLKITGKNPETSN